MLSYLQRCSRSGRRTQSPRRRWSRKAFFVIEFNVLTQIPKSLLDGFSTGQVSILVGIDARRSWIVDRNSGLMYRPSPVEISANDVTRRYNRTLLTALRRGLLRPCLRTRSIRSLSCSRCSGSSAESGRETSIPNFETPSHAETSQHSVARQDSSAQFFSKRPLDVPISSITCS